MKRNRFTRALHHLNKKHVVESAPTNNTTGVFSVTPSGVGPVGWTDRTFTTDISGNPIPSFEVADFTVGENPENSTEAQDTSGLFEDDGVTVKTLTPPGDNSYILGPFSSMWYAWGNFTTLGYIRQSDRRMVNLGTITGKLSDWDGSSINSYGQLTLEQALWFRDVDKFGGINNDPANHNYRAFYPGPPSTSRDAFGRYLCVIADSREAGGSETRPGAPDNPTQKGEMSADDNFSKMFDFDKRKKGDPSFKDVYDAMSDINDFLPPDPDYDVDKQKEDAENIDKIYDEWKDRYDKNFNADGSEKTAEQKFNDFRSDNLPNWAKSMENWAKNLPWNNPNNPVGKFINNNSWWIEPVVGAIAGAAGAKNAYKAPYKIPNTKVNAWKNSVPKKHTSGPDKGKYKNIELFNNKGDLIGKKYKENGKWKTKMRPTNKTSIKDKIDWEIDQLQHTNKSFTNYQKTGKNPGLNDLDFFRLTKVEPGSTFVKGADGKIKYSGGTVGANWALNKAAGAGMGAAAGAAMSSGDNQSNVSTSGTPDPDGIIRNPGQPQVSGTIETSQVDLEIANIEVRLSGDAATNVNRPQSEINADKRELRKLQQRKEQMADKLKELNARRAKGEYVDPAEYKNLEVKPSLKLKTPNAVNKNNNKNNNKNLKSYKKWVIQEYINNPLLFKNKKFHIRVYFLYIPPNQGYLLDIGKIFTAKSNYIKGDYQNQDIHDTHLKSTPKALYFDRDFVAEFGVKKARLIVKQMLRIFKDVLKCIDAKCYTESPTCYEVFGADVMIDEEFVAKLIEVNTKIGLGSYPGDKIDINKIIFENTLDTVLGHNNFTRFIKL